MTGANKAVPTPPETAPAATPTMVTPTASATVPTAANALTAPVSTCDLPSSYLSTIFWLSPLFMFSMTAASPAVTCALIASAGGSTGVASPVFSLTKVEIILASSVSSIFVTVPFPI